MVQMYYRMESEIFQTYSNQSRMASVNSPPINKMSKEEKQHLKLLSLEPANFFNSFDLTNSLKTSSFYSKSNLNKNLSSSLQNLDNLNFMSPKPPIIISTENLDNENGVTESQTEEGNVTSSSTINNSNECPNIDSFILNSLNQSTIDLSNPQLEESHVISSSPNIKKNQPVHPYNELQVKFFKIYF